MVFNMRDLKKMLLLSLAAITFIMGMGLYQPRSFAAIPKLNNIRVALFINYHNYNHTTPTITLASSGGLTVAVSSTAGLHNWLTDGSLTSLRGTIDQYMIQLLETSDFNKAYTLKKQLSQDGYNLYIFQKTVSGKSIYQVWTGPYGSSTSASTAKTSIVKQADVLPLISIPNNSPKLTGPLHLSAGNYTSVTQAVYTQTNLSNAGIESDLAYSANSAGEATYSVWLGNEVDQAGLDQVKQQTLKVLPSIALQQVNSNAVYLLERNEVLSSNAGQTTASFFFNGANQKVVVAGSNQGKVTVQEKGGRSYRGNMELSQFNGQMALVNEVPFEQYLYGVVGAEMSTGWPIEALKAQAVAARTYALLAGVKYQIANISDSTTDQVYNGQEYPDVVKAVDATKGQVLVDKNGLVDTYFSANAGGITADPSEVWTGTADYLKSFPSPGDVTAQSQTVWRHIVMANGTIGYVHSAYLKDTGLRNDLGLAIYECTDQSVNVRTIASSTNSVSPPIGVLNEGDRVTQFGESLQSGSYSWMRGPINPADLLKSIIHTTGISLNGALLTLEVTKRGPSGRITGLQANDKAIKVTSPDSYRTVLGSIPSTLVDIEQTGKYNVLGANGKMSAFPQAAPTPLYVQKGLSKLAIPLQSWFIISLDRQIRMATTSPQFIFHGKGFGHGLGMSQDGANGLALQGYDYQQILKSYYAGVSILNN